MHKGSIHRQAVICKDYYVIRTIDDLFIFSGADRTWRRTPTTATGSERMDRFYGWVEGLQQHAADRLDNILGKVAVSILRNEEIPHEDREPLEDVLEDLARAPYEEQGIQLEPFLSTLARALAYDGLAREVAVIAHAKARLELTDTDRFTDACGYRLYLQIPYKLYAQVEPGLKQCEEHIDKAATLLCAAIPHEYIAGVTIVPLLMPDDQWRDKALAWLTGEKVNNQGRVRSNNVAPRTFEGLQFRSQPEIHLFQALRALGVTIAPLPVFLRERRRIEPDIVILKSGIVMIVEVDGDTFHHETPAEADDRTTMLENEGAYVVHIKASECDTLERAGACAKRVLQKLEKLKEARR